MSQKQDRAALEKLAAALNRPNRILVEEVLPGSAGAETDRRLWIAKTNKPDHSLRPVDPDLFGMIVTSDLLIRGPDPNVWSHRDRYDDNLKRVTRMAKNSGRFLRQSLLINALIGIATLVFVITIIMIASNSG
ncbi:hypothetical protein GH722_06890 [Alphaproteobacteria bacterium HT1-32]|nr:hypothetical protein [Alphaproteobacteria bacterium HT1-32]